MNGSELEEADVINAPVVLLMMSERQRKGSLYRKSQSSFELDKLSSPTTKNDNNSNLNHNNNNNNKITISNDDDDDDEDEGTDDRFQITNFGVNSDVNMLKIANNIHNNINNNNNMMPKNSSFNDSLIYYSSVRKTINNINKTSTLPTFTSNNNSAITQQQQQRQQQHQQQQHQQPLVTSAEDLITFGSSDSSCISIEFDPLKQQHSTASLNSNNSHNNNTNIANINATITNNDDTFNNNKTSSTTTTDEGPPLAPIRPSRMKPVARVTRPVNTISTDLLPSTTVPHQHMPPQLAPPQLTPPQPMPRRRDTTNTSYNHHRVNTYMSQSSAHSRNGVVISDWIDCVATDAATAATTVAVTATAATTSTATTVAAPIAGSGADEKASQNYVDVIFDLNCLVKSVNDKLGDNNSINSSNTSNNNNNNNNTNKTKQGSTAVINATTNIPPNVASSTSFLPTTTSFAATTKTSSLSPPRQTRQSLAEQIKQARTAFIQSDLTIPIPPPGFDSFDPLSTGQLIIDDQSRSGSTNSDQSKLSIFHLEPSQRSSADLNQASRLDDQLLKEWNLLTLTSSTNATTTTTNTTTSLQPQRPVTSYQYNKSMPDLVSQLQQQQQLHQQPHHNINNSSKMLTQQQLQQLYTQRQMPPQYQQQQHQQRPNSRFYLKPQLVPYPCRIQSSTSSPTNTQYQISNMIRMPNYFSPDFSPTTQKYSTLPHFTVPTRFYANLLYDKNTLTTNTDSNTNSGIGTLLFGAPSFEARSVARKLCAMSTNNTTNNNKDNTNNNNNVNNNNKNNNKEWETFD
ncbi:hypothetical protein HELRODRAFT_191636 [Helobdella robusta]|uniref:Uncharacterized protein n=1 Tax=Helobdella robusta TaxID=6412 RepID=T1FT56_HELRO|nr:hypothetical protein HELRODRAFT_191636 [Helobdella robusta]ESO04584.1 hypothetical protein HELRODRAFT_191636 [Helobdella robusta]